MSHSAAGQKVHKLPESRKLLESGWFGVDKVLELASVLECSEDAIICTSLEGEITTWNRSAQQLYGYSADEVSGLNALMLAPPDKAEELSALLRRVAAGESIRRYETQRIRKDRSLVEVSISESPIRDEDGRVVGIAIVAHEISERINANARLRTQAAALEAAATAILITDACGTILWVNPAFTAITGYSKDEVLGKTPSILSSGVQDEAFYTNLWNTIIDGKVWQGEIINRHKNGVFYAEEMSITPVRSDSGALTHFIAMKQDITSRKAAEAALRHAEEGYRNVVENSILGIFQSAPRGCFFCMNRAMAEMLGYESPEQAIAEVGNIRQQLWVDPEAYDEALKVLLVRGELLNYETEVYRRDGTVQWLSFNVRCVYGLEHDVMYFEGIAQNIDQRKRLENQLQQAQKMEALGRLAGGVAHDFNNMLSIISGYGELLLALPQLGEKGTHFAKEIRLATQRASSLTQQLLAFSRKQLIQPRMIDLNSIFKETGNMLRRLIGDDVALEIQLWPEQLIVRADPGQMQQVIMNLAVNSRDAMPEGGSLGITTAVRSMDNAFATLHPPLSAGHYAEITVEDTGCGMDRETMAHIFEPFFTTKGSGRGTGLGLSIIYGIVEQAGGHVLVDSQPGQGTRFTIYLPLQKAAVDVVPPEAPICLKEGNETVLLVEDDTPVRLMIAAYLEDLGYTILQAGDGAAGLEEAHKHRGEIDLVLSDIMLPKVNGYDMVQQILSEQSGIKAIYMSGQDGEDAVSIATKTEWFLPKPFALYDLAVKLRQAIGASTRLN